MMKVEVAERKVQHFLSVTLLPQRNLSSEVRGVRRWQKPQRRRRRRRRPVGRAAGPRRRPAANGGLFRGSLCEDPRHRRKG
ncbi:MAG: hypothetical protein NZ959_10965 [Armatimonadetes bacterium]|nr:hypothetical protein [Armatimonadota bacterium]MDW8122890.1 hypothetical protein [Armatimonadota bacterium]